MIEKPSKHDTFDKQALYIAQRQMRWNICQRLAKHLFRSELPDAALSGFVDNFMLFVSQQQTGDEPIITHD